VFGIEHVSGQTKARVKLLAAGGTLPVNIKYVTTALNETDITFTRNGQPYTDLHKAFGDGYEETPINVGEVTLDAIYSDEFSVNASAFSVITDASKFKVYVHYDNGTESGVIGVPDYNDKSTLAPQAFLIADPNWQWPAEMQCITAKYPEFTSWVANADKTSWCGSIWGKVREFESIPSYAVSYKQGGNIQCDGNVATITLGSRTASNTYWTSGGTYKLTILTDVNASINFTLGEQAITSLPNGTIEANKVTTFTITPEIVEQILNGTNEPYATITFASGVTASEKLRMVTWYMENSSVYCGLEFSDRKDNTDLVLSTPYNGDIPTYQIKWTTNNRDVAVKFESNNTSVATVSDDGLITAVGAGEATVKMYQSFSGSGIKGIYGGNRYIKVKVNKRNANLSVPTNNLLLSANGEATAFEVTTASTAAVSITDYDSNIITVTTNDNKITVTPKASGTTTFKVKQEANDIFNESETITITAKVVAFSDFESVVTSSTTYDKNQKGINYNETELIFGDSNVSGKNYIDLSNYSYLKLKVAQMTDGARPRFLFNRVVVDDNNPFGDFLEIRPDHEQKYLSIVTNTDGTKTYYVNLSAIKQDKGKVNLNVIKSYGNIKVSSIEVSSNPSSAKRRNVKK